MDTWKTELSTQVQGLHIYFIPLEYCDPVCLDATTLIIKGI